MWVVDDFVFYSLAPWHDTCAGLAGGCPAYLSALANAEALDAWWIDLCKMLCVPLNMAKHQRCGQTVEYSGFLFDTFRGVMLCLDEKLALLRSPAQAADLGQQDRAWSLRDLDRVKGSILHYSAAVRHLRIRVTEMQRLMGQQEPGDCCELSPPSAFSPTAAEHYNLLGPLPAGLGRGDGRRHRALLAAGRAALAGSGFLRLRCTALQQGTVALLRAHVGRVPLRLGSAGPLVVSRLF